MKEPYPGPVFSRGHIMIRGLLLAGITAAGVVVSAPLILAPTMAAPSAAPAAAHARLGGAPLPDSVSLPVNFQPRASPAAPARRSTRPP
jgi:hypothetical protein